MLAIAAAACGGGDKANDNAYPAAGRYAFARSGTALLAIPLDGQRNGPLTVSSITAEQDFALPVERPEEARHHDLLLINGGKALWVSGRADGHSALVQELDTGGQQILACGHKAAPDDPAVTQVRARQGNVLAALGVRFATDSGCISATGDKVLWVTMAAHATSVLPADQVPVGIGADGAMAGSLRLAAAQLYYRHTVNGTVQEDPVNPVAGDVGRITGWSVLAQDVEGAALCATTDATARCALYYFAPAASPQLTKLADADYDRVTLAGVADGRLYLLSIGPAPTQAGEMRMSEVREITLDAAHTMRVGLSMSPADRAISLDQSVLFGAHDMVRDSEYYLSDAATGDKMSTQFVMYGSGASSLYADHMLGCVVAKTRPLRRVDNGCAAMATIGPNYFSGVTDRTVHLYSSATEIGSYVFKSIARANGLVAYETVTDMLVATQLGDGKVQLWRVPLNNGDLRTLVAEGDVTLYGTIRPRGYWLWP
ncbi:hypothetical protein [Niveibacterium umoris]|uniref:Uncharacterized protein n=1 Tax=Niveibacterium umoris TaxID=1193620 RepID=A0A840BNU8_9RHOO|nr:hypothetical protein [Niveibacterium umoris]MBB4014660.1 hypothetical protein [Niveibacterium umoris]